MVNSEYGISRVLYVNSYPCVCVYVYMTFVYRKKKKGKVEKELIIEE